jgi:beta-phosphoglucomutase
VIVTLPRVARADDYDLLAAAHPDLVMRTLDDVDLEALREGRLATRGRLPAVTA